jgi:N-formylglutamate deformylase
MSDWLSLRRGNVPLLLSIPHTGTEIPAEIEARLVSSWLGRKDTDWWVDRLYQSASSLDATVVRTAISRTVIDVNRDPSGQSLYTGQATTDLCPTITFDGEAIYPSGQGPDAAEIEGRKARWFAPYHAALKAELERLRKAHDHVVLYDCHSIRSVIPRLFDELLPHFNIGTNDGASCAPELTAAIEAACAETPFSRVRDGRFRGGYITRHYGKPEMGIHAIQMELACRGYLAEPVGPVDETDWPPAFDITYAAPMATAIDKILQACVQFATSQARGRD